MAEHKPLDEIELWAWLGEDELGSGIIGIKQALVPAGMIPLVAIDREEMERLTVAMEIQAGLYGKRISLCRFKFVEAPPDSGGEMSAPAAARASRHIHLPSVHVRDEDQQHGYDYEEDIYVFGRGWRHIERIVRFVAIQGGAPTLIRETRDRLCPEELAQLREDLPYLMEEGNPAARAAMEECARKEIERQRRIAAGVEQVCARCGCSESRGCSGGCCWATESLCSRCVS